MTSPRLRELVDKRDNSRGMEIAKLKGIIHNSMVILDSNYNEFAEEIIDYENTAKGLWDKKRFKKIDEIHKNIIVCLHNYLASLYSFRKNIESIRKKFGTKFRIKLEKQLSSLDSDPNVKIALLLRHHIQHFRPPFTNLGHSMTFDTKYGGIKEKATFVIKTKNLLENSSFKKHEIMLKNYGKTIDLNKVVILSYKRTQVFYTWLWNKIDYNFYEDLQELRNIQIQIDRLIKKKP